MGGWNLEELLKKLFVLAMVVAALTLGTSRGAFAQDEITVLAPGSIRQALGKLAPMYQQKTGHAVKVTFGSGAGPKLATSKSASNFSSVVKTRFFRRARGTVELQKRLNCFAVM